GQPHRPDRLRRRSLPYDIASQVVLHGPIDFLPGHGVPQMERVPGLDRRERLAIWRYGNSEDLSQAILDAPRFASAADVPPAQSRPQPPAALPAARGRVVWPP